MNLKRIRDDRQRSDLTEWRDRVSVLSRLFQAPGVRLIPVGSSIEKPPTHESAESLSPPSPQPLEQPSDSSPPIPVVSDFGFRNHSGAVR
ncbi:MAG: hypothetical protein KGR69_09780, partial [Verrucomicrobia bacterium]|nr:hypothetical protein [Verrucomicrobiota bacterium]